MRLQPPILGLMVLIAFGAGDGVRADTEPVSCALVVDPACGLAASPFADLVSVQLASSSALQLLDRAEIDRVLAEHQLTLSGAAETPAWQSIGSVLRARMLVHLWARQTENEKTIDYELIETATGLRVARGGVVWEADLSGPAEIVAGHIARAAGDLGAGVQQLVAVPPFESSDFAYDLGDRRFACAALIEEYLSQIPGVAVVEFANADQIARELAVSRGTATVGRDLPVYVTGWLRTEPTAENRNALRIRITATRAEAVLWQDERGSLSPDEVRTFLAESAGALAGVLSSAANGTAAAELDTAFERRLLAERVRARQVHGEWPDVVRVGEAYLLLDPANESVRRSVAQGYGYLAADSVGGRDEPDNDAGVMKFSRSYSPLERRRHALAGTAHWYWYFRNSTAREDDFRGLSAFLRQTALTSFRPAPPGVLSTHQEVLRRECAALAQMIAAADMPAARSGLSHIYAACWCLLEPQGYDDRADDAQRLEAFVDLLVALDRFPFAFYEQIRLAHDWQPKSANPASGRAFDTMLATVQSRSTAGAGRAARLVALLRDPVKADPAAMMAEIDSLLHSAAMLEPARAYMLNAARRQLGIAELNPVSLTNDFQIGDLHFAPLPLRERLARDFRFQWRKDARIADAGPGRCCVAGRDGAVLIQVPDHVVKLNFGETKSIQVADVAYDGKYLWVTLRTSERSIRVFNPDTAEQVAEFVAEDGVFSCVDGSRLAAIAPGRVLIVGAFGRTWAGILEVDDALARHVRVFFTADRQPPENAPNWSAPNPLETAFVPEEINLVPAAAGSGTVAVIWRARMTPLVADLSIPQVQEVAESWGATGDGTIVHGDTVLVPYYQPPGGRRNIGLIDPRARIVRSLEVGLGGIAWHVPLSAGLVGEAYHIVGEHWWTVDLRTGQLKRDIPLPHGFQNGRLTNCALGLIYFGNSPHWEAEGLWRVTEVPPAVPAAATGSTERSPIGELPDN